MSHSIVPQSPHSTTEYSNSGDGLSPERREYLRTLAWRVFCERQTAREILAVSNQAMIEYALVLNGEGTDDPDDLIYRLERCFDAISNIYAAEHASRSED